MHICVIGAGASGLTTAKHLLEQGLEIEVLEKRDGLGGLWYFDKTSPTVAGNTQATTSKSFLQFSDFPFKETLPHFLHHQDYLNYLKAYADNYQITPHIRYSHEVIRLWKEAGSWKLTVRHHDTTETKSFDAVAVCSGLHHVPLMPEYPGQQDFQGEIIHSSLLKDVESLDDKHVLIVGGGESAGDVTHDVAQVARRTYMSLRKGMIVLPKWFILDPIPADLDSTRAKVWLPRQFLHDFNSTHQYSPLRTFHVLATLPLIPLLLFLYPTRAIRYIKRLFDWQMWQALLKPNQRYGPADGVALSKACHQFCQAEPPTSKLAMFNRYWALKTIFDWYSGALHNSQPFTKSPKFMEDIIKRNVRVVPKINRYGTDKIRFEDGFEVKVDTVIMCTGFRSRLPFFEPSELDGRDLYKNVFLPGEPTLAFIGFARGNIGAMPPLAEMQARWFSGIVAGWLTLPDKTTMEQTIKADAAHYTQNRPQQVKRLTSLVDYHGYLHEIAGFIGCRPKVWQLIKQPKLLYKVLFGPYVSYQFRIHGPGANRAAVHKAMSGLSMMSFDRILTQASLYFFLKPFFVLLSKLGLKNFRPIF